MQIDTAIHSDAHGGSAMREVKRIPRLIDTDLLFDTTVTVFAERGYDAATTQEIARRAGVSEVTLFRRYGSKLGLIRAALAPCLARSPFAQVSGTGDVRADLLAIVRAYAETNRAYGGAVLALLTEMSRHAELGAAAGVLMPNLQQAARVIAAHQEMGHIGPGDPLRKVALLIAPVLAAGLWARSGVTVAAFAIDAPSTVEAFLHGHGSS